jgi:tRNA threonylcarbamoyladenosine biosynthesis protein TsaB
LRILATRIFFGSNLETNARRINKISKLGRLERMVQDRVSRILLLETSGRIGQVAVALGDGLRGLQRLDGARRHARDLAPTVRELLRAQGWDPASITATVVSRGPGSYTGLRVGIMSANAFAYATGCQLLAVDTFHAIAEGAPAEMCVVEVIADAQQERVYCQVFRRMAANSPWQAANSLRIEPLGDWLSQRDSTVTVTGPGLHVYGARLPDTVRTLSCEFWDPSALAVLRVGNERFRQGIVEDPSRLEPLYLRPSSAEEKWRARAHKQASGEC